MKIFYCAFESIFDPVFDSQVLVPLKKINDKFKSEGRNIDLIVFGSIGDIFKKKYWSKRAAIKKELSKRVFFTFKFPYFFKFPFFFDFSLFLNSVICFKVLLLIFRLKKGERAVFHCRSEIGSYIVLNVKRKYYSNIRLICDCRGLASKEILYKDTPKNKKSLSGKINRIEKIARLEADYLLCVSKTFKEYILRESNSKIKNIEVIPCCVDVDKFKYDSIFNKAIRKELGIGDESFIILYSGSLNEWQLPARMIEIFKIIAQFIENSIFLILTRDIEYAQKVFTESGLKEESYIIRSVAYTEINKYLPAGDLGLLIRENNDVNRVAFPVKFAEYIRCGVPLLSSISSDVMELITELGLGFKLENFDDDEAIEKIAGYIKNNLGYLKSNEYKNKISDSIKPGVDWDYYIPKIIEIYEKLI